MSNGNVFPLFPQTPLTPERDREREKVSDLLTESLSTTRARARGEDNEQSEKAQIVEELAAYYCATFGAATMPPVAERCCLSAMAAGMDEGLIFNAMDEAAMAPRPSWAYAAAIIRRLMQEECFTWDAYEERQQRWQQRHYRRR